MRGDERRGEERRGEERRGEERRVYLSVSLKPPSWQCILALKLLCQWWVEHCHT